MARALLAVAALALLGTSHAMRLWPFGARAAAAQKWSSEPIKIEYHIAKKDARGSFSGIKQRLRMRTKPEMLQQALGVRPGGDVTVDPGKWKSLLSTGIFHEIHGYYKPTPEGTVMTVHVREAPSLLVSPEITKSYAGGFMCGIIVQDQNLFGMGQRLSVNARGDPLHGSVACKVSWMKRLWGSPHAVAVEGDFSTPDYNPHDPSTVRERLGKGLFGAAVTFLSRPEASASMASTNATGLRASVQRMVEAWQPQMDNGLFIQQLPPRDSSKSTIVGTRTRLGVVSPLGPAVNAEVSVGSVGNGGDWKQFQTGRGEVSASKTFTLRFLKRLFRPGSALPELHIVSSGRVASAGGPGYVASEHGSSVGGLGSARGYGPGAFGTKRNLAAVSIEAITSLRMMGVGLFVDGAIASDKFGMLPNYNQWTGVEQMRGIADEVVCLSSVGVCLGFGPIRVDLGVPSLKHDLTKPEIGVRLVQPLPL